MLKDKVIPPDYSKTIYVTKSRDRENNVYYDATLNGENIDYAYDLDHLLTELARNYPEYTIDLCPR